MKKSILVIGATGKQGFAVVKKLLADGWHVRALTRRAHHEGLASLNHANLDIFVGDLSHEDDIMAAMHGQFAVYCVQPIVSDGADETLRRGQTIIKCAEKQGVNYIVLSTAGGVNRNRYGAHFEALAQIENTLATSTLAYTIIKPSFFMDNFLRIVSWEDGVVTIPEFINPHVRFAMISSIDIANIVATIFNHIPDYAGQSIEIAADMLTLNEVVMTFENVLGYPTKMSGTFMSETAERTWLEEKGYEINEARMAEILPEPLRLKDWITHVFMTR